MASQAARKRGQSLDLCQLCLSGGTGHTGHLSTADNCFPYDVTNPTRRAYQEVLRQYEMARGAILVPGRSPRAVPAPPSQDEGEVGMPSMTASSLASASTSPTPVAARPTGVIRGLTLYKRVPPELYQNLLLGLHPLVDVIDDFEEAKGHTPAGDDLADDLAAIAEATTYHDEGGNPDAELKEEGQNTVDDKGPQGHEGSTSAPRLQLLQERDAQGNFPLGLDAYDTVEEKWKAHRRESKTTYGANHKEQRCQGSWTKDQPRWTRTAMSGTRCESCLTLVSLRRGKTPDHHCIPYCENPEAWRLAELLMFAVHDVLACMFALIRSACFLSIRGFHLKGRLPLQLKLFSLPNSSQPPRLWGCVL